MGTIDEGKRAGHYAERAEATEEHTRRRTDPAVALRRIEKLEAEQRRVHRSRKRCTPGSDYAAELDRQLAELGDQITYWLDLVSRAEAEGFKVWSRDDFARGDFVRYDGTLYEVLRVNAKSVTIPHPHIGVGRAVVRKGDGGRLKDWTWRVAYTDGITGHMSAEDMRKRLAEGGSL